MSIEGAWKVPEWFNSSSSRSFPPTPRISFLDLSVHANSLSNLHSVLETVGSKRGAQGIKLSQVLQRPVGASACLLACLLVASGSVGEVGSGGILRDTGIAGVSLTSGKRIKRCFFATIRSEKAHSATWFHVATKWEFDGRFIKSK